MTEPTRLSFGLLGRVFAILLLTIAIEFGVSTLLYERAGQLRVREDEAHRVAEKLALASALINAQPRAQRPQLAERLSRETFVVKWHPTRVPPVPLAAELGEMRMQIVNWEPALAHRDLRLHLKAPGRSGIVMGQLGLDDGSSLEFKATQLVDSSKLSFNRFLLALITNKFPPDQLHAMITDPEYVRALAQQQLPLELRCPLRRLALAHR